MRNRRVLLAIKEVLAFAVEDYGLQDIDKRLRKMGLG